MIRKPLILVLFGLALASLACGVQGSSQEPAANGEPPIKEAGASGGRDGEALFSKLNCNACHVAGAGHIAPSLDGLFGESVTLESGETVIADEEYIRRSILDPHEKIVAGFEPVMPSFEGQISEGELDLLVDYIKALGD